ncbi:MAG: methyltransferase domain-containing protein [Dehalococcoidia bacterium]
MQQVEAGANTASARHDALAAAYEAQRAQFGRPDGDAWGGLAKSFQMDPRRPLDELLTKIAAYVRPDDTLIDVGGGAGRLSLPLALRCREVVIVDPSPAMGEVFRTTAGDAGIQNARFIQADWLDAGDITGDVALVTHVTYFVRKIAPFVEKLQSATRRRVVVGMRSVPPPNQVAPLFRLVHGEELAPVPGHKELLGVLDEISIAADVIDVGPAAAPATLGIGQTRDDAIRYEVEAGLKLGWLSADDTERARDLIDEHFDDLFAKTDKGFWRRSALEARDLLITWETP